MEDQPFDFSTPIMENTALIAQFDCPNGVTLTQLRSALNNGTAATTYPVGTQIDDTTNGNYDPWIIGHYGTRYGDTSTDGVYLYRKYVYPETRTWGNGATYGESDINSWLNSTYLESCSDDIKNLAAEINVPLVSGSTPAKMFLMSAAEVLAVNPSYAGGVVWSGWQNRTGLVEPSTGPNQGRVMGHGELTNSGDQWLLRTEANGQNGNLAIEGDSSCRLVAANVASGVVPACFIPKAKYDPSNPTLDGLKQALDAGDYAAFPAGTEIPDTYDGNSNPLIVAQYLDSTNNSAYSGAEGVILVRKFVEPVEQQYSARPYENVYYEASAANTFLQSTYLDNCSDTIKGLISNITVPYYQNSTTYGKVSAKWFLMSTSEMMYNNPASYPDGIYWDYWKQKTGLSNFNQQANNGRVVTDRNGTTRDIWLRYNSSGTVAATATITGALGLQTSTNSLGVLPACFISKSSGGPITTQEYNDLNLTAEEYNAKSITVDDFNNNAKGVL